MTKDEVLMMALEALKANDLLINGTEKAGGLAWCIDGYYSDCFDIDPINEQTERAITAIKEALAQPEQEPVAWMHPDGRLWTFGKGFDKSTFTIPLYTTPPQRTWVELTNEELTDLFYNTNLGQQSAVAQAIALLKQKNGFAE